jgi:CRISPR-associated protein Csb2
MHRRRETLIRKALLDAGFGEDLAVTAHIETQEVGYLAGGDLASRYSVPSHLRSAPRFHIRWSWTRLIAGPICLGSGRFSGMGLFVGINDR